MTTNVKTTNNNEAGQKKRRKFKMPSSISIIIGVVVFATIITWIPHGNGDAVAVNELGYQAGSLGAWQNYIFFQNWDGTTDTIDETISMLGLNGYYDETIGLFVTDYSVPFTISGFSDGVSSRFGLFDSVKAMLGGYLMAWEVALYIITLYTVVLLLMDTNTLKNGVGALVKGLGGREMLLIPILFVLFSLGGTLFGMQEETLGLLTVVSPVLIVAGFDAATAMLLAVVGCATGVASSVLDPFSIGVMAEGLGEQIGTGIIQRLILWTVLTGVVGALVTMYAARVRKNNEKGMEPEKSEENLKWAEEHIGDIENSEGMTSAMKWSLIIFAFLFVWMVFVLMPWVTFFPTLGDSKVWVGFSSIFFGRTLIGEWFFVELSILFLVAALVIGKLHGIGAKEVSLKVIQASKEMFGVVTIIAFSRSVSVILQASGLTYGMIYGITNPEAMSNASPVMFSLIWLMILTMMSFFIPSTSGLAAISAPIVGGFVGLDANPEHQKLLVVGILLVYPIAQGVVNMFSPTQGIVLVQCEVSRVSYSKALPWLGGLAAVTFVVGSITALSLVAITGAII